MISDYCRDKDGAVASMMLAELAAQLKAEGRTLHDYLSRCTGNLDITRRIWQQSIWRAVKAWPG